jgi:hypothetical protein
MPWKVKMETVEDIGLPACAMHHFIWYVLGDLSEQTLLVINRCSSTSGSEHNNLIKYDTPFISKQVEFLELGTINNGVSNISCLIFDHLQVSFFPSL